MKYRIVLLAVLSFALFAGACTSVDPTLSQATVVTADTHASPEGIEPAIVWTIDGERVASRLGQYPLSPGHHTISVVPLQDGSLRNTLAYGESALQRDIRLAELDFDLKPGQQLQLAAVVRRHRTYSEENGVRDPLAPWQTTVLPYVVQTH